MYNCKIAAGQNATSSSCSSIGSCLQNNDIDNHYGSILWHDVGKNPILVGYVVLGIGYGVSAHDLSGYKVLGVLVVDNGPHVKEPLTALLKPIPKS